MVLGCGYSAVLLVFSLAGLLVALSLVVGGLSLAVLSLGGAGDVLVQAGAVALAIADPSRPKKNTLVEP